MAKYLLVISSALALAGCGLKGPLYMPSSDQPQNQSTTEVAPVATSESAADPAVH